MEKEAAIAPTESKVTRLEFEIPIDAPVDRVWKAIVEETGLWWRKDFYASKGTQRFVLEPWLGGRVYEDAGNGAGVLWYTINAIEPNNYIEMVGHFGPAYGGPVITLLRLTVESVDGDRTLFRVSDSMIGTAMGKTIEDGWRMMFEQGLKPYVEQGIVV